MPQRAPRLCQWCRKVVVGRCLCRAAHQAAEAKRHDRARGTAKERGYGTQWHLASQAYLQTHRWCKIKGPRCTMRATCVDHIVAHKGDMALFWNRRNWQAACKSCNSWKAASKEGGYGND